MWIDKKYQSEFNGTNLLKDLIGKNNFSYPKSIYAVLDIIKIMSGKGDIVLDFFGGSGTTAHAVLEANIEQNISDRHFILCEQLSEHIEIINRRLHAVLEKHNNSESFISVELAQLNQKFVEAIQSAENDEQLASVWFEMRESGFISSYVKPSDINADTEDFNALSFEDKKRLFIAILDKNMLYVNYCDIDDESYAIADEDKAFTHSFYKES